jgi:hypothetical protein
MNLVTAALVVVLGAFVLGALIGYFVPGKKNKFMWYGVLIFVGFILSLFFALGAYVFTQNSIFFFASKQVGVITFGGSLLSFAIIFFMFVAGLALGDLHHTRKKTIEEVREISES